MKLTTSESVLEPASPVGVTLPERPLVSIKPSGAWVKLNLRDLWLYRDLLYFLVWRDVKVRYKQTALGATWAVVQPLFTMLVFSLIFGRLGGMKSDGIPYPLFAYAGLLPWTFFANAVTASGNSLIGNSNLITKVYFPRMLIPAAAVLAGLVDFAITFLLLVPLMFYYHVALTWHVLLLPVLLALTALLAMSVGMWMSGLNVKYRDVRHTLPFLIQLWFFASPIIYPASIFARWRWLLALNPMSGIIEGYRAALFGRPFDWPALALSAGLTLTSLVYSAYSFRRMERRFADVI
ncbi:MAG TPA: ABC transporter permease [Pyrinomonadaceae bacterium]|jgi:lipopolysaccharide transport system permease protein